LVNKDSVLKFNVLVLLVAATVSFGCSGIQGGVSAYERGDYPAALVEFRPLAEQGYRLAQYTLGVMYVQGQGVPQDYHAAVKWFGRAAGQGVPQAQFELGKLYQRGLGVPQNFVMAHAWMNLATAGADPEDAAYYARERDALAVAMTPEQLATAQRVASESLASIADRQR
jgi:TPR repeat protein